MHFPCAEAGSTGTKGTKAGRPHCVMGDRGEGEGNPKRGAWGFDRGGAVHPWKVVAAVPSKHTQKSRGIGYYM